MMRRKTIYPSKFAVLSIVFSSLLAACASDGGLYDTVRDVPQRDNFAEDSELAFMLDAPDRMALRETFLQAMNSNKMDEEFAWRGPSAVGTVESGALFLANLMPDPDQLVPVKKSILLNYDLETEQGDFVLTRNSNIRKGPSTDFDILETLPSGTAVEGVGKVTGERWMMVSADGHIRGYVFDGLIVKAPGAEEFALAGGPVRRAYLCREFIQSLNVGTRRDRWQGLACDFGEGWELANRRGPAILIDGSR